MTSIEFFIPSDGAIVESPTLDWLKDLVLTGGEEFWNAGAGQANLKRNEDGDSSNLLITFAPTVGFFLEYIDVGRVYYVSIGQGTFDESVVVYIGGDPVLLPTAYFITRELASLAIEEFFKSGGRSEIVNWKKRSETNWHYGYPSDS